MNTRILALALLGVSLVISVTWLAESLTQLGPGFVSRNIAPFGILLGAVSLVLSARALR